ncbi:PO113 protein, partial [Probosciger aterrimus]|nr:PO113 protein [Probosciger aterrimus]
AQQHWVEVPKFSKTPLTNAVTVYTDAGKKSRKAVATWVEDGKWVYRLLPANSDDSLQTLELLAVVWTFSHWMFDPLNIVSDSLYVVGLVQRIEEAYIKTLQKPRLFQLLC